VNGFARLLSYLFHPLLMPTYLFLILAEAYPAGLDPIQSSSHFLFIVLIFIVTFFLPVLNLAFMKLFGSIRSFQMETRNERILPFSLIAVIYIFITYLFYYKSRISIGDNFLKIMIIIDLLAIVATLFTVFYKISIHSLTAWGIVAILILLNKTSEVNSLFYPAIGAILATGFIMSARVYLQAHTLKEVMWGGIAGLATGIIGMIALFTP
jgi:hypothetical protein